ncbi:MAG: hypothetical protein ACRDS9_16620 [Pseudonocardiaceae bacterium]
MDAFKVHDQLIRDYRSFTIYGKKRMLPLYEAKMLHHYDHRWATYQGMHIRDVTLDEKQDPNFVVLPRYWVSELEVDERLVDRWDRDWLLGWRDICRSTDERTMIASLSPLAAVGHKMPLAFCDKGALLNAIFSSFAFDFFARQKVGGTSMAYFIINQLPVPEPSFFDTPAPWFTERSIFDWMEPRILELNFDTRESVSIARVLNDHGSPFCWDDERRAVLRAELDATFFCSYGMDRNDINYVLDTFPIVKRKDEAKYGDYRTKRLILEVSGRMAEAIRTGKPYQTNLDPLPGQGRRHPAK